MVLKKIGKRFVVPILIAIIVGVVVVFFAPLIMQPENGDFYECSQGNCIHHIRIVDSVGYHYLGWGGQLLWPAGYQVVTERVDFDSPYAAYPCQNAIIYTNSSGTFYICPHRSEISNVVFSLPAPVYKKVPCTSTYGCARPYGYQEIIPPNLLSQQQKQVVIDKVMNLPEVKLNSGWTLDHFIIQPRTDKWIANVQIFLAGIKQLPPSLQCGWYGSADVDLETLEILDISNIPPSSDVKC
jgi:hypothetical protein